MRIKEHIAATNRLCRIMILDRQALLWSEIIAIF
jgi:hypothetical protein